MLRTSVLAWPLPVLTRLVVVVAGLLPRATDEVMVLVLFVDVFVVEVFVVEAFVVEVEDNVVDVEVVKRIVRVEVLKVVVDTDVVDGGANGGFAVKLPVR